MSLPYVGGMITGQGMDPRALNAGNMFYSYGNPVMSFPNFSAGYGQGQRVKNSEETASDKTTNSSSQLRLVRYYKLVFCVAFLCTLYFTRSAKGD